MSWFSNYTYLLDVESERKLWALPEKKIAFGIIAREKRIASTDLAKILQLSAEERLRSYIDNLDKKHLITKGGVKSKPSANPVLYNLWKYCRSLQKSTTFSEFLEEVSYVFRRLQQNAPLF